MARENEWDDARLAAAFRARFPGVPEPTLLARIQAGLADSNKSPARSRWSQRRRPSIQRAATPLLVGSMILVLAVASLTGGLAGPSPSMGTPSTPTTAAGTATPAPDGTTSFGPTARLDDPPIPTELTVPGSTEAQPVLTVEQVLQRVTTAPPDREIVVGGWYSFQPVPCAAIPDPTSELENCAVDFTWLSAAPGPLSAGERPTGPAFNVVIATTDWIPPAGDPPAPVVVVGHFDDRRADECPAGDRQARCKALFVVDAPLWTADGPIGPTAAPNAVFDIPVGNVADAIRMRDRFADEIAVAGWYNAPSRFSCPQVDTKPRWLVGSCEDADRWLMADPEQLLVVAGGTETHLAPKGDAFQVAFATTPAEQGNGIPDIGLRVPIPVVFVGHFHDRRSSECLPSGDQSTQAAHAACGARFVVDAVAWANGGSRDPMTYDWRETESLPMPDLDIAAVVRQAEPTGVILNQTLISGASGLPMYEPEIAAKYPALASQPSLWAVTVLRPRYECPTTGPCLAMIRFDHTVVLVIGPNGRIYRDPAADPQPGDSGS